MRVNTLPTSVAWPPNGVEPKELLKCQSIHKKAMSTKVVEVRQSTLRGMNDSA
jgi:hypothetical protein